MPDDVADQQVAPRLEVQRHRTSLTRCGLSYLTKRTTSFDRLEPLASPGGPRILTPHPGEFARLAKLAQPLDWDSQARLASEMAARFGVVIVLKGSRSLITNGTRNVRNLTGNPGMATGGSGDVLTGLITALVCQGLSPFDAAYLGCHVHGLAGDLAAEKFGQVSLIARDLIDFLPGAFRQLAASSGS